jgi:hypothetical protein
MPNPKKRDNAYWLPRLRDEHPHIYDRLVARKLASVREACIEAGLIRQPTRLEALKREWKRASASEHREFLDWTKRWTPSRAAPVELVDVSGFLTASAIDQLEKTITSRGMKKGDVMEKFGYKRLSSWLGMVMARHWKPKEELLKQLAGFLGSTYP